MTEWGDLAFVGNDIVPTRSVKQAILIRLRWFLTEWIFNPALGVDYWGKVFKKNPNETTICQEIAGEVRKVPEVIKVVGTRIVIDRKTRKATIYFHAYTSREDFDMELDIWDYVNSAFRLVYDEDGNDLTVHTEDNSAHGRFSLVDGDME